eukprot:113915-Prorocentrum_minimum.AAC.4
MPTDFAPRPRVWDDAAGERGADDARACVWLLLFTAFVTMCAPFRLQVADGTIVVTTCLSSEVSSFADVQSGAGWHLAWIWSRIIG